MEKFVLFTDVSVNPQQRLGVGACLLVPQKLLAAPLIELDPADLSGQLLLRRFTDTSSSKLELQTVLWGIELYRRKVPEPHRFGLQLYTDSHAVAGLPGRRSRLEKNAFIARSSGRPLANRSLYEDFFAAGDELDFEIIAVAGHAKASTHDSVQRIFSIVDRGARRALKIWMDENGRTDTMKGQRTNGSAAADRL